MITSLQGCNVFLTVYIVLSLLALPLAFFLMFRRLFPISVLVPLVFTFGIDGKIDFFDGGAPYALEMMPFGLAVALLFAIAVTVFVHSRKTLSRDATDPLISDALLHRKQIFTRILLFVRDMLLALMIVMGAIPLANVALDTSDIVECKVTATEVHGVDRVWERKVYVHYYGSDPYVEVTSIQVADLTHGDISVGDEVVLNYRKGFFEAPYYWVAE